MKKIHWTLAMLTILVAVASCKKQTYTSGGTIVSNEVKLSTYDFLKADTSHHFDTVMLLIDKAGLKDLINQQDITFFSPTNFSISKYLSIRAVEEFSLDPTHTWTIDSMIAYELPVFTAAIKRYIVKQSLTYDKLSEDGTLYTTSDDSTQCIVSYETTTDGNLGYNGLVANPLRVEYFHFVLEPITPPFVANELDGSQVTRFRVQTSGLKTTSGILNVLQDENQSLFTN